MKLKSGGTGRQVLLSIVGLTLTDSLLPAAAQTAYPSRPVRAVVAFGAGGFADNIARQIAFKLGDRLGQRVVIENRPGAGGNLGAQTVARSAPDGYTLLVHTTASAINITVYKDVDVGFNFMTDLIPVANTGSTPGMFSASSGNPAADLTDLINRAKARGGFLTFGSAGVGTSSHIAAEYLFNTLAGLKATHVPYKTGALSGLAVVAGEIDVGIGSLGGGGALGRIREGKMKPLAVASLRRVEALPNVPTVAESGFRDFEERSWVGFFAPVKVPAAVVNRLNKEINGIVMLPEIKDRWLSQGMEPQQGSPAEFAAYFKKEVERWARSAKGLKIEP